MPKDIVSHPGNNKLKKKMFPLSFIFFFFFSRSFFLKKRSLSPPSSPSPPLFSLLRWFSANFAQITMKFVITFAKRRGKRNPSQGEKKKRSNQQLTREREVKDSFKKKKKIVPDSPAERKKKKGNWKQLNPQRDRDFPPNPFPHLVMFPYDFFFFSVFLFIYFFFLSPTLRDPPMCLSTLESLQKIDKGLGSLYLFFCSSFSFFWGWVGIRPVSVPVSCINCVCVGFVPESDNKKVFLSQCSPPPIPSFTFLYSFILKISSTISLVTFF
eukprot:TRINITY_DN4702_c0_g1_i1.p1 TRINITY_DN4702_c0_g1~~TRINITY_DN4702_c0_g1_i1.p1  ORF type:complete len:269 (+),score=-0.01 TRINITY_DN4702_c0_g1_i1:988-1794(+)